MVRNESLEAGIRLNDTENLNSYFTENILRFHYQYQYINAIQRYSRYLFRENAKQFICFLRPQGHFVCVCKDAVKCVGG